MGGTQNIFEQKTYLWCACSSSNIPILKARNLYGHKKWIISATNEMIFAKFETYARPMSSNYQKKIQKDLSTVAHARGLSARAHVLSSCGRAVAPIFLVVAVYLMSLCINVKILASVEEIFNF